MLASVIIPTFNEEKHIRRCVESALANGVGTEGMEVIVADGHSGDKTRAIVMSLAALDSRLRLIDNPKRIQSAGVNAGIRVARGQYIVRMDAHAEYPADYIWNCVKELERTGADNVGGCVTTIPGADSAVAHAIALALQHPFGVGASAFRVGWADRYVDTVPFGAFPRHVFDRVGLFNEEMVRHEDFELNARIRRDGGRIFLSSKIRSSYIGRPTLRGLTRQMYLNGIWNARAWVWFPKTFSVRRVAAPLFVLAICVSAAVGPFWRPAGVVGLTVGSAYSIIALIVTLQLLRGGGRGARWLPAVFVAMHVPFGVGVLGGLVQATLARTRRAGSGM